jgi:hypothetical protein
LSTYNNFAHSYPAIYWHLEKGSEKVVALAVALLVEQLSTDITIIGSNPSISQHLEKKAEKKLLMESSCVALYLCQRRV